MVLCRHVDSGRGAGQSRSLLVALGAHTGGQLVVEGCIKDVLYAPVEFDGWHERHWTLPFHGERFSLVWFTPVEDATVAWLEKMDSLKSEALMLQKEDANVPETVEAAHSVKRDVNAGQQIASSMPSIPCSELEQLNAEASAVAKRLSPPFEFRSTTTDCLVVLECLRPPGIYAGPQPPCCWPSECQPPDFSPRNHSVVDIGAHVGAFTRYALEHGAARVVAFEPEPQNAELFRRNTAHSETVVLHELAVAQAGIHGAATLILGRDRHDGMKNTWRHALEGLSHYREGDTGLALQRVRVRTARLLGEDGVLPSDATFVKVDCEGAEIDLLTCGEAWPASVTRLVFEWSFTKERSMRVFHGAVKKLQAEGFCVACNPAWATFEHWPWHNDALIFAARCQ